MHTLTLLRSVIALLIAIPFCCWAVICLFRYSGAAALVWFVVGVALAELVAPTPDALRAALDRVRPKE